ncbi:MAG: hypothetical protein NT106_08855 [Candidatus Sumerlaeota bacterium]|nr:hypothetical protein [Candidatus Sumerlaeota bacterium]
MRMSVSAILISLWCALLMHPLYADSTPVEGVYFTNGISCLIDVEPTFWSYKPRILYGGNRYGKPVKIIAKSQGIIIIYEEPPFIVGHEEYLRRTALFLEPSPMFSGDWDLAGISSLGDNKNKEKELIRYKIPLKKPIPSYMRRVKDERIIEYFRQLAALKTTMKSDFDAAFGIWRDSPRDFWARAIYLDALIRNEKWDEAAQTNAFWRADFEKSPNPFIVQIPQKIEMCIAYHRLSSEGQNAWYYLRQMLDAKQKESFESLLEKAAACKGCVLKIYPLTIGELPGPNLMGFVISTKLLGVESDFAMIKGDNKRALHLLTLTYRLSQFISGRTSLIDNIIGMAIKSITCRGMQVYLLNACKTPEDIKGFFDVLSELKKVDVTLSSKDYRFWEVPDYDYIPEPVNLDWGETEIRWNVAEINSRLLMSAAAARYNFLKNGQFPKEPSEFAPLLPDGLPLDLFSDKPLKLIAEKDPFVIYSIGPDKTDDHAAFAYDPTNGTISPGDVFIEIPKQPRYPFPPKGQLATTKEGIMRQFPNGLPGDPFHDDERNARLSITDETPARIISFGPNADSSRVKDGKGLLPLEPQYDPTNGTISPGDLIMETGKE